ncbi:MAG TPA: TIGR03936 family radical SAM-associated protein [Acidimicrobiales bacterium]|nr:TIGR03936 family radical SAM-associated protein [Acidimicrobiales bacterium]
MRVRLRFSKVGKIRWTSHRDLARMWERGFRRVQLPLAYTQGFSPRPKVSFGLALPTGAESVAEYLDIELAPGATVDVDSLPALLTPVLPAGVDVSAAAAIDDRADSLQHEVSSCSWRVEVVGAPADKMERLVADALAADSLVVSRERKGRLSEDDIRPGLLSVTVAPGDPVVLECELAAAPRALRPTELLRALSPDGSIEAASVRRTAQWILRDGARSEPLPAPLDATDAPPAPSLERAS